MQQISTCVFVRAKPWFMRFFYEIVIYTFFLLWGSCVLKMEIPWAHFKWRTDDTAAFEPLHEEANCSI